MKPFIIAVAGGSGSGKTTLAKSLANYLNATIISMDNYYKDQSAIPAEDREKINYDHPDCIEWDLLKKDVNNLLEGKIFDIPIYDFKTHTRKKETQEVNPKNFIIIEGILALHDEDLNKLLNYKIFVDVPEETRLKRRMDRDITERHRTIESTLQTWNKNVKPMHDKYVEPSKNYANFLSDNEDQSIKIIKEKIFSMNNEK